MEQHPTRIGKYDLEQFLGGGMSHVYRAVDTVLRRTVAVKILTEQGCQDPEAKARFLQEAITASGIQHPNIIKIYDYGEENGRPFIVMEFLVGEDLRDAIHNGDTGDLRKKLDIALQVARGIAHVHSRKIIHRDIKPENIHLDPAGHVRLMDFGIAKSEGFSLTKTGFSLGTPYYMSPEQVLGQTPSERVDVYAFGVLLFELLTGTKPVTGDSVERLFYLILNEPLDIAVMKEAGLPEFLQNMVSRCTEKKPEARYTDFHPIIAELDRAIGAMDTGSPLPATTVVAVEPQLAAPPAPQPVAAPVPPPPRAPESGIRLGPVIGVAAAVLVLGGMLLAWKLREPKAGPAPAVKQELQGVLATETGDMVLVPAGKFLFGKDRVEITLPAYYIDRTEVSNEAYAKYLAATGHSRPPAGAQGHPGEPMTGLTIGEAQEFAKWAGKRLPTTQEWEKAARGADGRTFSWGDDRDPERANVEDNPVRRKKAPMPVVSFENFSSPFHTLNMTGNVWEFVSDPVTPSAAVIESYRGELRPPPTLDEPWVSVKGGSYQFPLYPYAVSAEWLPVPARYRRKDIGLRCVKDPAGQR